MKIYRKLKIDILTGEVLEEDSFHYQGPVALCKSDEAKATDPYDVLKPPDAEETAMLDFLTSEVLADATDEDMQSEHFRAFLDDSVMNWMERGMPLPENISPAIEGYITKAEQEAVGLLRETVGEKFQEDLGGTIADLSARRVLPSTVAMGTIKKLGESAQKEVAKGTTEIGIQGLSERVNQLNLARDTEMKKMGMLEDVRRFEKAYAGDKAQQKLSLAERLWQTKFGARHEMAQGYASSLSSASAINAQASAQRSAAMWGGLGNAAGTIIGAKILSGAPAAAATCLPETTLIWTPEGEKQVIDFNVGDSVIAEHGKTTVNKVSINPITDDHEFIDLVFADGTILTASPGHPIPLFMWKDDKGPKEVLFGDVKPGMCGIKVNKYFPLEKTTRELIEVAEVKRSGIKSGFTCDILPDSENGLYIIEGFLVDSTLKTKR